MWRPGTNVVVIAKESVEVPPWGVELVPGWTGVVVDEKPWASAENKGMDLVVMIDHLRPRGPFATQAKCWRPLDDTPTNQSAESFLQSLSKPKVEA